MKLSPTDATDVLSSCRITSVGPWDILVTTQPRAGLRNASSGIGTTSPSPQRKAKYGNRKYSKRSFMRYIDYQEDEAPVAGLPRDEDPVTKALSDYVLVVEFYDLVEEKMVVWSPDYR
jgi:hypothetical protein